MKMFYLLHMVSNHERSRSVSVTLRLCELYQQKWKSWLQNIDECCFISTLFKRKLPSSAGREKPKRTKKKTLQQLLNLSLFLILVDANNKEETRNRVSGRKWLCGASFEGSWDIHIGIISRACFMLSSIKSRWKEMITEYDVIKLDKLFLIQCPINGQKWCQESTKLIHLTS